MGPYDLPKVYVDFPLQVEADDAVRCPARSSFGCDAFGCFGYVYTRSASNPHKASNPHRGSNPRVAPRSLL